MLELFLLENQSLKKSSKKLFLLQEYFNEKRAILWMEGGAIKDRDSKGKHPVELVEVNSTATRTTMVVVSFNNNNPVPLSLLKVAPMSQSKNVPQT